MPSTIPALKAALVSLLGDRPALANTSVSWAGPTRDEDFTGEMIFFGEANSSEGWQDLSPQLRRQENYRLTVTVWVEQWGDDPQTVEERLWVLWDEVKDALREDLQPNGTGAMRAVGVLDYGEISFRQVSGPATPEKWGARLDGQINFRARNV